jgi:hypothetical protein
MRYYACKKSKFLLNKGPLIGSPFLFVCGATYVKSLSFSCKLNMTRWSIYDREDCPMLSWDGASDQIKNVSSLDEDLSCLLFGLESPFYLCY